MANRNNNTTRVSTKPSDETNQAPSSRKRNARSRNRKRKRSSSRKNQESDSKMKRKRRRKEREESSDSEESESSESLLDDSWSTPPYTNNTNFSTITAILRGIPKITLKKRLSANNASLLLIDMYAKRYNLSDDEKIMVARRCLDKNLQKWALDCSRDIRAWPFKSDYEEFKTELKKYLKSQGPMEVFANRELLDLKQTGLIAEYGKRFEYLLDYVNPALSKPKAAFSIYRSNLNSEMFFRVVDAKVLTWSELHEYCENVEKCLSMQ